MVKWFLGRVRDLTERQSDLSVSYLIYTFALGFSGLLQLGLLFFMARVLPTGEFGVVGLLMVAIPLVGRLTMSGSDIALAIRIWRRPRDEQTADLGAIVTWSGVLVGLICIFAILFDRIFGFPFDVLVPLGLLSAAFLRSHSDVYQVMLRREGRVARVGAFAVARATLFAIACVSGIVVWEASARAYLLSAVVAELFAAIWGLCHLRFAYGLRFFSDGSLRRMRDLVRIGFPSIPSAAATLLLAAGDRFVIGVILGVAATGVYAFGQRLAEYMVQILFVPFVSAFGPHAHSIARHDQNQAFELMRRTALTFSFLGGVIAGFPVIFGREMIIFVAGPDFEAASTVFVLVIAAALVWQICQILAGYFSHTEQLRKYMWIIVASAGANVLLNMLVVPMFGIAGAAIVSIIVYEAILILVIYVARRDGVALSSLRQLHAPLLLFFLYLILSYAVDSQGLSLSTGITCKSILWIVYLAVCLLISSDFRVFMAQTVSRVGHFFSR